jgi:hypothetical protein
MGDAATWADRAKYGPYTPEMITFTNANPYHHSYHYTDVPIQETSYVDGAAGTSSNDIVHILPQCIEVLRGHDTPKTNPHGFSPRIALLLLVHLVGDLHQPLHVGAAYFRSVNGKDQLVNPNVIKSGVLADAGGNWLHYKSKGLHSYWDNNGVERAMARAGAKDNPQLYATIILQDFPNVPQTPGSVVHWPKRWADEMLPVAAKAHKGFKFGKHQMVTDPRHPNDQPHPDWPVLKSPSGYDDFVRDTVEERITTAGFRLAHILRAIWP